MKRCFIDGPLVFNIQRFSVHDGPGIRTTVFLKGCSLRCRWCHNPESFDRGPQLQYFAGNCSGCGSCNKACSAGIRTENGRRPNSDSCTQCGACAEACMFDALKLTGKAMTPDEVLALVRRDKLFYDNSGGGLTASGGEPLLYPDFCAELFAGARAEGIHTALDTAANVPWEHFAAVLPYTIAVLLDLKIMDEKLHTAYTGSSNGLILENARRLFTADIDLYVRIPVIAGVNDSPENAKAAADFLRQAGNLREVSLLPYHGMGVDKARSIGLEQESFSPPGDDVLPALRAFFPCQAAEKMGRTAL